MDFREYIAQIYKTTITRPRQFPVYGVTSSPFRASFFSSLDNLCIFLVQKMNI